MKKQLIIIGIIFILLTVLLCGCPEQDIHIVKLKENPDNFVNISEEQMKNFPHLKEALLTNKSIDITNYDDEEAELRGVLDYFDTRYICYRNEYYEIQISYAD